MNTDMRNQHIERGTNSGTGTSLRSSNGPLEDRFAGRSLRMPACHPRRVGLWIARGTGDGEKTDGKYGQGQRRSEGSRFNSSVDCAHRTTAQQSTKKTARFGRSSHSTNTPQARTDSWWPFWRAIGRRTQKLVCVSPMWVSPWLRITGQREIAIELERAKTEKHIHQ